MHTHLHTHKHTHTLPKSTAQSAQTTIFLLSLWKSTAQSAQSSIFSLYLYKLLFQNNFLSKINCPECPHNYIFVLSSKINCPEGPGNFIFALSLSLGILSPSCPSASFAKNLSFSQSFQELQVFLSLLWNPLWAVLESKNIVVWALLAVDFWEEIILKQYFIKR